MLIIFDCDGVLVDSERLAAKVFSQSLRSLGLSLSENECFTRFKGHTLKACYDLLSAEYQFDVPSHFDEFLRARTEEVFGKELKAVEGVVEVLEALTAKRVSFCVASNGGHAKIEHSLAVTGLLRFFPEYRFSSEDVKEGKPAPDLFLYAAEAMGVPPNFTRVVEDSAAGLKAAAAAKMQTFYFCPQQTDGVDSAGLPRGVSATHTVTSMSELIALI